MSPLRRPGLPDPVERELVLLLSSCLARRRESAERCVSLLERCDDDRLLALLRRLRLTAIVGRRAVELADPDRAPSIARAVTGAIGSTRRTSELQAVIQGAILERLTTAGIAAAPLKGPELAQRLYSDLALRPSADVDILVDPRRLAEAVDVLRTLGYSPAPRIGAPWFSELHEQLVHRLPELPVVEVHWRVEWYSAVASQGGLALAALARSVPHPTGHGRQLAPADELALLLLVYARDALVGLRLPADIAAWWDRYGGDVRPGALQEIVDADPPLATPLATAALRCAQFVGLPADQLLDLDPARTPRARLAARLADPFLDEPPAHGASTLVDGLLSSRRALRPFLRRRLLLPAGHVAVLYGDCPAGSLRLRLLMAQHPLRQLAYYAWFLGSPPPLPPERY